MVVVNVNPLYTARELDAPAQGLRRARRSSILANAAAVLEEALPGTAVEHVIVTEIGDLLPQSRAAPW